MRRLKPFVTYGLLLVVVAVWAALRKGNRDLRDEIEKRSSEVDVVPGTADAPPQAVGIERNAGGRESGEVAERIGSEREGEGDGPIIVAETVEELAGELGEMMILQSRSERADGAMDANAVAEVMRRVPALAAALLVHADALAGPENSGKLMGRMLATYADLNLKKAEEVTRIVIGSRRTAAEEGLFERPSADAPDYDLWIEKRRALQADARERIHQVIGPGKRQHSKSLPENWNVLHGVDDVGQILGGY